MLRQLFFQTGYPWAVRASALLSAACCVMSLVAVRREGRKKNKCSGWVDVKMFKDARFMLLAAGSFFICLGKKK